MKKRKIKSKSKKKKYFPVLLTVLLLIVGIAVMVVSGTAVSKNLEVSAIKKDIRALEEENRDLETRVTRLQSLQSLEQPESMKNSLVPVERLRHLVFPGSAGGSVGSK